MEGLWDTKALLVCFCRINLSWTDSCILEQKCRPKISGRQITVNVQGFLRHMLTRSLHVCVKFFRANGHEFLSICGRGRCWEMNICIFYMAPLQWSVYCAFFLSSTTTPTLFFALYTCFFFLAFILILSYRQSSLVVFIMWWTNFWGQTHLPLWKGSSQCRWSRLRHPKRCPWWLSFCGFQIVCKVWRNICQSRQ